MVSDPALLLACKDARIAELEAALAAAQADISARDILIDTLRVQIARLKRMTFGKSSEKLDLQIENGNIVTYRARINVSFKYESGES